MWVSAKQHKNLEAAPRDELALATRSAMEKCEKNFEKTAATVEVIENFQGPQPTVDFEAKLDLKKAVESKSWRLGVTNPHQAEASCLA